MGSSAAEAYRSIDPDLRRTVAELPLVGLTMLAPGHVEPLPTPDDGHRPLLFVHGLGGGPGNFVPLRAFFRLHGRRRCYAPPLPAGLPLPEQADFLASFIRKLVTVNSLSAGQQVDVIAHSMGGLVSRLALEEADIGARVATLLTMGTPHGGSHLARYGARETSLALRPGSALITRLARQLPWVGPPEQPRLVSLWSTADVVLLPATSALVDGAENVELPGTTHNGYLIRPGVWRQVLRLLSLS